MAVIFDATANTSASTGTSITWTHAGAASPSNYLAIVGISYFDITVSTLNSVSFGGQAMTQIIAASPVASQKAFLFGLINPPAGSQTVQASFSANVTGFIGGSSTFTGADQITGWHNATSVVRSVSGGALSLTITSA